MITARRNTNSKCINKKCTRYHKLILAKEPRGIVGLDSLGREKHICMTCVIESRESK